MSDAAETDTPQFITVGTGAEARDIAYIVRPGAPDKDLPTLLWLSGYRSDMSGTKAVELDRFAAQNGFGCIRLDYSGHGASKGRFVDGTISRWLEEVLAVLAHIAPAEVLVVGSSMGGWIALRLAQELQRQGAATAVAGMVLIAPAPDFTSDLIEPQLSDADRAVLTEKGYLEEPSAYSPEPNIYTQALIEDGRKNRVLNGIIEVGCAVHILQGMEDKDVPYLHAMKLVEHLPADDVVLTFVRDGDHRLSRPQDIAQMLSAVENLVG